MTFLAQEDHAAAVSGQNAVRLNSCGREGFVTRIRVVDDTGADVPKDSSTPGEIIVQSEANMLGYWEKPELTADTLKDGWMHTGDVAVWDEAGYVFIVDRAKDMIISGGENIYSTQVEAAIHQHPGVLEAAVIGIPDDEWGEAVMAYVVMKPGESATAEDIIATAREHLASYQKPRAVAFVDSLPKAPTGKILKRDLRNQHWPNAGKTGMSSTAAKPLLRPEDLAHIGKASEPALEVVNRRDIRKYSIATNQLQRKYLDGDIAPPLFHVALFWPVVELTELMPDGVAIDRFVPTFPLTRAMAGGLHIEYHKPIRPGDALTGVRTLTNVYEKAGRSGALIFYEVVLNITDDGGAPVITETTTPDSAMNAPNLNALQVGDALPQRDHTPDNAELFFYNAALWNAHRIHYDMPYAQTEEGYDGLVIAGPQMGDWMTQVVDNWMAQFTGIELMISELDYSNRAAAIIGETLTTGGEITAVGDGRITIALFVKNEKGEVITPGQAVVKVI